MNDHDSKILVTGGNGKLATELRKQFKCLLADKQELDVTNYIQVENFLKNHKNIDFVIHTAAITSVEKCEKNKELTYNVNVEGTRNLLKAIKQTNPKIKIIYISTPCIFDGKKGDYTEESIAEPENYYGITKLISEELIKSSGLRYLIARVNFVKFDKWEYPKAFTDRYGTYLFADQIATKLVYHINNTDGILHIVGEEKLSMFELAKITTPDIKKYTMKEYEKEKQNPTRLTKDMSMKSLRSDPVKIRGS